uniref:Uncharacterized protein n=1 Tax=Lepeophtheirus salmonis TaxID=72036 RepID=A0A0K2U3U0_LEPSM
MYRILIYHNVIEIP